MSILYFKEDLYYFIRSRLEKNKSRTNCNYTTYPSLEGTLKNINSFPILDNIL